MQQPNEYSGQFLRRRKMLLMVPGLFVPMLCLAFYGLGGGRGDKSMAQGQQMKGLNMTLPLAQFTTKSQPQDKVGYYEKAKQDSLRRQERRKQDPYANGKDGELRIPADSGFGGTAGAISSGFSSMGRVGADRQADEVMKRLERLKQALAKPAVPPGDSGRNSGGTFGYKAPGRSEMQLRALMDQWKIPASTPGDPEVDRLDGMLDKLIRIQHPEGTHRDSLKEPQTVAATVSLARAGDAMATLGSTANSGTQALDINNDLETSGFMEIGQTDSPDTTRDAAIEAVVGSDQTLTAGSTVELRITRDIAINGTRLPAGQLVYGQASLAGERLLINVSSIRVGQSILPVSMQVYDLDGLAGIRVPGAITRDVSKESADQALGGLSMTTADGSAGAQAAAAGLTFARSLASRKIRLVRVSLPAGYRVFLKNGHSAIH
jgi:Conjugative transposon, TraM